MADTGETLLCTTDGAVVTLTLNRPEVLNAMDAALAGALKAAFDEIESGVEQGKVRAVVLTGAG